MATLDASSTTVFTLVTPIGRRGWSGGGQTAAVTRSTRNAETRPPKNMTSPQMRNSIASRTLSSGGRRGAGSRSGPSSPPRGGGIGGRLPLVRRGTVRAIDGEVVTSDPTRNAANHERHDDHEEHVERLAVTGVGGHTFVEGQQREKDRQIQQRGEQDPPGGAGRRRQRLARASTTKRPARRKAPTK